MNVKQAEPLGSAFLFLRKWMTGLIVERHFRRKSSKVFSRHSRNFVGEAVEWDSPSAPAEIVVVNNPAGVAGRLKPADSLYAECIQLTAKRQVINRNVTEATY